MVRRFVERSFPFENIGQHEIDLGKAVATGEFACDKGAACLTGLALAFLDIAVGSQCRAVGGLRPERVGSRTRVMRCSGIQIRLCSPQCLRSIVAMRAQLQPTQPEFRHSLADPDH